MTSNFQDLSLESLSYQRYTVWKGATCPLKAVLYRHWPNSDANNLLPQDNRGQISIFLKSTLRTVLYKCPNKPIFGSLFIFSRKIILYEVASYNLTPSDIQTLSYWNSCKIVPLEGTLGNRWYLRGLRYLWYLRDHVNPTTNKPKVCVFDAHLLPG